MNDHEPPSSLDKAPPGDNHAGIPSRVTRLEVMVDEVIRRLDKLDSKVDRLDQKIDNGLEKLKDKIDEGLARLNDKIDKRFDSMESRLDRLYYLIFMIMSALLAGVMALLAKVIGVY